MTLISRILIRLASLASGKPFVEGRKVVYPAWEPKKGVRFFYPSITSPKPSASSDAFSRYFASEGDYRNGLMPYAFATEKDALEASRRCRKVLEELHEELGY